MIYRFLKGVVNDFSRFAENVLDARSYFVPFSSRAVCDSGVFVKSRYFSDRIHMLNGEWDFWYCPDGLKKESFDSSIRDFKSISVPCSWENAGFEPKRYIRGYEFPIKPFKIPDGKGKGNSLGIYRKFVEISDFTKKYVLTFLKVEGRFEVHVNGVYCGFSALESAEFDVTPYLKEGINEILIAVRKWSTASYLSGGDRYAATGITGDVYLTEQNLNGLFDYSFTCVQEDDCFAAKLAFAFNTDGNGASVKLSIEKDGEEYFSLIEPISDSVVEYSFREKFLPYICEKPVLYDLYVKIIEHGEVTECTKVKLGFGTLAKSDGAVTLCGAPLKIKGVNYNAYCAADGLAMTLDDYAKDFALLKSYGFNTIHPTEVLDPAVIALAAEYGFYIIDRIGVNTSGMRYKSLKKRDSVAEETKFNAAVVGKADRLYNRDKCAPGVIALSFGEESGETKNILNAVSYIKDKTAIPILTRNKGIADSGEVAVLFNPSVDGLIDEINRVSASRPVFMSEYAMSGGIGSANLAEFDEVIENTPCCLGGCISYFIDECGEEGGFKDEGIFSVRRKPYAGALSHRFVVRPVRARLLAEDKLELFNTSYFSDTSDVEIMLVVMKNGRIASRIRLEVTVAPRETRELDVFLGHIDGEMYLNVECREKSSGNLLSVEQLTIHTQLQTVVPIHGKAVSIWEKYDLVEIRFDAGCVRFSKATGTIIGYNLMGKEILFPAPERKGGVCFNTKITRPFVRNIVAGKKEAEYAPTDFVISTENPGRADVSIETAVKINGKNRYVVQDKYVVYSNGVVEVFSVITPYKHCPPDMDCFGKQLRFHPDFEDVTYYGKGDGDNYIDLCVHALMGLYRSTATEMGNSCAFGQECGNRTDVHYAVIRDRDGDGLMLSAVQAPIQLRVATLSDEEMAESYKGKKRVPKSGVYVDASAFVSGYGSGGNEAPMAKYTVKSGEHILHFKLLPVYGKKD